MIICHFLKNLNQIFGDFRSHCIIYKKFSKMFDFLFFGRKLQLMAQLQPFLLLLLLFLLFFRISDSLTQISQRYGFGKLFLGRFGRIFKSILLNMIKIFSPGFCHWNLAECNWIFFSSYSIALLLMIFKSLPISTEFTALWAGFQGISSTFSYKNCFKKWVGKKRSKKWHSRQLRV